MFGAFRTLLALGVVFSHLGSAPLLGTYAVFGFYALSGFLMTLIMHETYGYTCRGAARYGINRLLRIYPLYLAAVVLSLCLVLVFGEPQSRAFHSEIGIPRTSMEWLQNAALVLTIGTETRLVPPAWALTVEVSYYILIGLGLSRSRHLTFTWLAASVAYTLYLVMGDASFGYRYYTIAAASLPFSLGASLYHASQLPSMAQWITRTPSRWSIWAIAGLIAINYAASRLDSPLSADTGHFYLNVLLIALLIAQLARLRGGRWYKRLGNLSYPIYLIHFQAGILATMWFDDVSRGELMFALASLPIVFALGWAMTRAIERPVESIRARIKAR